MALLSSREVAVSMAQLSGGSCLDEASAGCRSKDLPGGAHSRQRAGWRPILSEECGLPSPTQSRVRSLPFRPTYRL